MQTADFYSSATGTLRVNGGQDANAPKGVSLSVDDLAYIKQGSRANDAEPVTDYDLLDNKPQINNVTLTGNKSLNDLGIQPKIDSTHKVSSDNIDDSTATNKFATAEQLSQIETNKNNISNVQTAVTKLTPTVNGGVYNVTTSYSNISALTLNIPYSEGSEPAPIARISAIISIGNVGIRGVILSLSNDSSNYDNSLNLLAKIEQDSGIYAVLKTDTINVNIGNSDKPIYVWLKGADTGNVRAYSFMELLR